jgi:hypothetical protein
MYPIRRLAPLALFAAAGLAGCVGYVPARPVAAVPVATAAPIQQQPVDAGCREFRQTAVVGGQAQEMIGTACPQPDGTWRIIGPPGETAQAAPPPQTVYIERSAPYPVYAAPPYPAYGYSPYSPYSPYYGYGPRVSLGLGFVFGGGGHRHHRHWR